jgi:hypothetical protein
MSLLRTITIPALRTTTSRTESQIHPPRITVTESWAESAPGAERDHQQGDSELRIIRYRHVPRRERHY